MAFTEANVLHGKNLKLFVNQYDVSGYANSVEGNDESDEAIGPGGGGFKHWKPGQRRLTLTMNALFDDTVGAIEIHRAMLNQVNKGEGGSELVLNNGFETAGAGGADVFASWIETAGDGAIADETSIVQSGGHAAKLTAGATANTKLAQTIAVVGGEQYVLSFYARGDGTHAGYYGLYDVTNSADIIAKVSSGITAAAYTLVSVRVTMPATCVSVRIDLWCPLTTAWYCYFDNASLKPEHTKLIYLPGGVAVGDPALHAEGFVKQNSVRSVMTDIVRMTNAVTPTGVYACNAHILHLGAETVTGDGTTVDATAARIGAVGALAHLSVYAFTGITSLIVLIQHSTNGSDWSSMMPTFTATGITAERKTTTGAIYRYRRIQWEIAGTGSVSFIVTCGELQAAA